MSGYMFLTISEEGQDEQTYSDTTPRYWDLFAGVQSKQAVFRPSSAVLPPGNLLPT